MLQLFFIYEILVFFITCIGIWLAFWVYFTNPKSKVNKSFSLTSFLIVIWVILCYLANTASDISMGLFWTKLAETTVVMLLLSLYFFSIYFPQELKKRRKILDRIFICMAIILISLISFTDLITEEMLEIKDWGLSPVPGKLWPLFNFTAFFIILSIIYYLMRKYFELPKEEKLKVQYFLIGFFIFIVVNVIFNVILPMYYKNYQFVQLGTNSAIFLLAFTAYAIVKQELFGIRVVLTALLVGLIALLTMVDILFLTNEILAQLFKSLLLVVFLYFGYLLIQSVMREIQYRERLQKANKQLKKLDRAKSEFISIASHQLRSPLSVVKGYISMLSEGTYGNLSFRSQKPIRNVYKANERLIKLVNDLLSLSRIESGKIEIKLDKASLQKIISNLVEDLKTQAHNKNIYLRFNKPKTSLPNILIDQAKIKEVISNIIDNAIKYTARGGVTVTLRKQKFGKQEKAVIEIKDTGLGMTKREISKIFQSFSRGTAGVKLYTGGAGLGLYIAKKFANMHGGDIKAISEGKGKGSTFYIELLIK